MVADGQVAQPQLLIGFDDGRQIGGIGGPARAQFPPHPLQQALALGASHHLLGRPGIAPGPQRRSHQGAPEPERERQQPPAGGCSGQQLHDIGHRDESAAS